MIERNRCLPLVPIAKKPATPKRVATDKPAVQVSVMPQTGDATGTVLVVLGLLLVCALVLLAVARRFTR